MTAIKVTDRFAISGQRGRDWGSQCADGDTLDISAVEVLATAFLWGMKAATQGKRITVSGAACGAGWIGIELNPEYAALARQRIAHPGLFARGVEERRQTEAQALTLPLFGEG